MGRFTLRDEGREFPLQHESTTVAIIMRLDLLLFRIFICFCNCGATKSTSYLEVLSV